MSDYTIETRRRSRSKTPFLRSGCDHEHCDHIGDEPHVHHHKKKVTSLAPNVKTITEETVEVTSSSSVGTGKDSPSKMTQTRIKTSDYSSEESTEGKSQIFTGTSITSSAKTNSQQQHQQKQQTQTETLTSTTVVTKTKRVVGGGTVATSTPKTNSYITSFATQFDLRPEGGNSARVSSEINSHEQEYRQYRQKEHKQNILNAEKEINNSKDKSLSGFLGYSFGDKSLNFDGSDHLAYLEYKKAGEYWKTTPKTDYTYSELSAHRRELAPGVIAMPNMSRQSLDNHYERINYMIQRNPAREQEIRNRYESPKYKQYKRATEKLTYESGDEVDYAQYNTYRKRNLHHSYVQNKENWFMRLMTTIVTALTTIWTTVAGSAHTDSGAGMYNNYRSSSVYHTKLTEERGFFGSITHAITSAFLAIVRHLYLIISSVLCLDTWLLRSSNVDNKNKKRFLLFLLILMPLLLLAAWWLLDEQDRMVVAQRWHSLLPLSLITTLRSTLYTNFHTLKSFWPLFVSPTYKPSQNMEDIKLSLSRSMAPDEYENILNHINSYIHNLVDTKLQEQQQKQFGKRSSSELNTKHIQSIVQIIKENLETLAREKRFSESSVALSEQDISVIVQKVLLELKEGSTNVDQQLSFSPKNIEEIKNLIAQTIEFNNQKQYKLIVEKLNLDALIARLLKAPLFTNYIQGTMLPQLDRELRENLLNLQQSQTSGDDHLKLSLEQQKVIIDNLNKDIAFIKLTLHDKLSENEDLHYSITKLQQTQDALIGRLQELESTTDQRFANVLQEITLKISNLKDEHFKLLNQQVKLSLIEILGFKETTKDGAQFSEIDLQNWVRSVFVAKDYLELRLGEINNRTNDKIKQEIDKSGMFLMRDISERLKQEIIISVENKQKETQAALSGQIKETLSEQEVRNIVKSVLAIYDADKTGLVDFALESAGGQILSTRCTENYQTKTAQISVFGIPLWYPTNTPRIAISPNVQPGECWAFQGFPGFLILKLNSMVYVTGFTLEHIPKSLAPNGRIESAPRNFTVWGLEHEKDQEPILFGEYEYSDNDASLQYFPVQNKNINRPYEIVELRIESNHGHPLYTCLYRFRVHGKPPTT